MNSVQIRIPHTSIIEQSDNISRSSLNSIMRRALANSVTTPVCLELSDDTQQRFLFFREGQIYASGIIRDRQFVESTIREFLLAADKLNFPQLTYYELNSKILHSTLILFQKKPAQCVTTSLVDLDELLDRIEEDQKSCIVCAQQDDFVAMLRYERGVVKALCHDQSELSPREASFRDEFLVKIYTISAESPVTISVYDDLMAGHAEDAKTNDPYFEGSFEDLYLSKPPVISLQFKGKEIDHWELDRPRFTIGRTPDNDIVVDNLAVSRLHAVLEESKDGFYVRDCESLNGTEVNGEPADRQRLNDGDVIAIGKHKIVFKVQGGKNVPGDQTAQGFDQTMMFDAPAFTAESEMTPRDTTEEADTEDSPRVLMKMSYGDRIARLNNDRLTIGKDMAADLVIEGWFVAKFHAEIVRQDDRYFIRHVGGLRKVIVRGKPVREAELKDTDEIRIAKQTFIFHT